MLDLKEYLLVVIMLFDLFSLGNSNLPVIQLDTITTADFLDVIAHTKPSAKKLSQKYTAWQREFESVWREKSWKTFAIPNDICVTSKGLNGDGEGNAVVLGRECREKCQVEIFENAVGEGGLFLLAIFNDCSKIFFTELM